MGGDDIPSHPAKSPPQTIAAPMKKMGKKIGPAERKMIV